MIMKQYTKLLDGLVKNKTVEVIPPFGNVKRYNRPCQTQKNFTLIQNTDIQYCKRCAKHL